MSYKGATLTDTYPFPFKSTGFNLPWTALGSKTVFVFFAVGILLVLLPNNKKNVNPSVKNKTYWPMSWVTADADTLKNI